jgi:hypothetical protein
LCQELPHFGTVTLTPAFELDGAGSNVDSIAFWEAPDANETLMFVTGKANTLLEVWRHPFTGSELPPRAFTSPVNGVAVDQSADVLYVSDRKVSVLSLPDLHLQAEFGQGIIGVGENNLDILKHNDGRTLIYVSEDHKVHSFNAATLNLLGSFAPPVSSIETVLADDYYQMILVPEEQGLLGNPGVYAYHPDGTPFLKNSTNRFGNDGEFDSDEEGILLYTFPPSATRDDGAGFVVVSDQRADQSDFEFFDRVSWAHLGTLRLTGVSNTDGIASTQQALPGYPMGLFVAINNDTTTVGLGWDAIFTAIGWNLTAHDTRTPFEAWASAHGLTPGVNDDFADDPDNDDRLNVEEFATNSDPLDVADKETSGVHIHDISGLSYLVHTFPVRNHASFAGADTVSATVDGLVYSLSASLDLVNFTSTVIELSPPLTAHLPLLDRGWSYRTFRFFTPATTSSSGFLLRDVAPAPQ